MNKQVGYIASAHLILFSVMTGYMFISKIPIASIEQNNSSVAWCGTENQSKDVNLSANALKGKNLFLGKCASCHSVFKDMTGPALGSFLERGPWSDRKQLYKWVRNPEVFMKTDPYTKALKKQYGSLMTAFPNLSDGEIDAITEYVTGTNSTAVY